MIVCFRSSGSFLLGVSRIRVSGIGVSGIGISVGGSLVACGGVAAIIGVTCGLDGGLEVLMFKVNKLLLSGSVRTLTTVGFLFGEKGNREVIRVIES
jgi:hypothetical protein